MKRLMVLAVLTLAGGLQAADYVIRAANGTTVTNDVALYRVLELGLLDADTFYSELERYVNSLDSWRTIVTEFRASEPSSDAVEAEPPRFGADGFMMA